MDDATHRLLHQTIKKVSTDIDVCQGCARFKTSVRITPGPGKLSCERRRRFDRQRFHWETMVEPRLETARERPDPRDAALS
jgi:hypothetical protein